MFDPGCYEDAARHSPDTLIIDFLVLRPVGHGAADAKCCEGRSGMQTERQNDCICGDEYEGAYFFSLFFLFCPSS